MPWAAHDVAGPSARVKVFRHASAGVVRLQVVGFVITATPQTRMAVRTPVDEQSRTGPRRLIGHPGAPAFDHTR